MMRVADYLAKELYNAGIEDIFIVTGGGLMFLTDGIACHGKLRPVPCLHEQAASMAAISYAQLREGYGCCYVTSGCGGTNTITGVLHAYQDHVPVIYISGQVNRNEMMSSVGSNVRQFGHQEADIVSIVSSITKYAVTVMDPLDIAYCIEKAMYLASHGSPGPVWLDIPMDVQEAEIDVNALRHYEPEISIKTTCTTDEVQYVVDALENAERPIVMMGHGVRIAGACDELINFIERYQIPVVGSRQGWDIYPNSEKLHMGVVYTRGNRAANFAIQNADVVVVIASRLSLLTTGYNHDLFLRGADKVIVVDIDECEHKKGTVRIDKLINADAKEFLESLPVLNMKDHSAWLEKCAHWKEKWPMVQPENSSGENGISKIASINMLNDYLKEDGIIVTDAGATADIPMETLRFTTRMQRYLGSGSQCEMGYAIPASIGASIGGGNKEAICIVGDGSLQMNIQELQTIVTQNLPIKIIVWNNGGYESIRSHQKSIFHGRYVGVDPMSGTAFPELREIATAYHIPYKRASNLDELRLAYEDVLGANSPYILELITWREESIPISKAKMRMEDGRRLALPLEDMTPFIDRDEFVNEMIIEPVRWWEE